MYLKSIDEIKEKADTGLTVFMPSGIQATLYDKGDGILVEYFNLQKDKYSYKDFNKLLNEGNGIFIFTDLPINQIVESADENGENTLESFLGISEDQFSSLTELKKYIEDNTNYIVTGSDNLSIIIKDKNSKDHIILDDNKDDNNDNENKDGEEIMLNLKHKLKESDGAYKQADCPTGKVYKAMKDKEKGGKEYLTVEFKNELLTALDKIAKEYPNVKVRQQALTFMDELGLQEYWDTKAVKDFCKKYLEVLNTHVYESKNKGGKNKMVETAATGRTVNFLNTKLDYVFKADKNTPTIIVDGKNEFGYTINVSLNNDNDNNNNNDCKIIVCHEKDGYCENIKESDIDYSQADLINLRNALYDEIDKMDKKAVKENYENKLNNIHENIMSKTRLHEMIIDVILDRQDDNTIWTDDRGPVEYNTKDFYDVVSNYGEDGWGITNALDNGTEDDVKTALKNYVDRNEYNPEVKEYIDSVQWLDESYINAPKDIDMGMGFGIHEKEEDDDAPDYTKAEKTNPEDVFSWFATNKRKDIVERYCLTPCDVAIIGHATITNPELKLVAFEMTKAENSKSGKDEFGYEIFTAWDDDSADCYESQTGYSSLDEVINNVTEWLQNHEDYVSHIEVDDFTPPSDKIINLGKYMFKNTNPDLDFSVLPEAFNDGTDDYKEIEGDIINDIDADIIAANNVNTENLNVRVAKADIDIDSITHEESEDAEESDLSLGLLEYPEITKDENNTIYVKGQPIVLKAEDGVWEDSNYYALILKDIVDPDTEELFNITVTYYAPDETYSFLAMFDNDMVDLNKPNSYLCSADKDIIREFIAGEIAKSVINNDVNDNNIDITEEAQTVPNYMRAENTMIDNITRELQNGKKEGYEPTTLGNWLCNTSLDSKWEALSEGIQNYILSEIAWAIQENHDLNEDDLALHITYNTCLDNDLDSSDIETLGIFNDDEIISMINSDGKDLTFYISYEIKFDKKIQNSESVKKEQFKLKDKEKEAKKKRKKLVEETGEYEGLLDDVASDLEHGFEYNTSPIIEGYGSNYDGDYSWGKIEINGTPADELIKNEWLLNYILCEISYPVKDGHASYSGLDTILVLYKEDLEHLTEDVVKEMVEKLDFDEDKLRKAIAEVKNSKDSSEEVETYIDYDILYKPNEEDEDEDEDESLDECNGNCKGCKGCKHTDKNTNTNTNINESKNKSKMKMVKNEVGKMKKKALKEEAYKVYNTIENQDCGIFNSWTGVEAFLDTEWGSYCASRVKEDPNYGNGTEEDKNNFLNNYSFDIVELPIVPVEGTEACADGDGCIDTDVCPNCGNDLENCVCVDKCDNGECEEVIAVDTPVEVPLEVEVAPVAEVDPEAETETEVDVEVVENPVEDEVEDEEEKEEELITVEEDFGDENIGTPEEEQENEVEAEVETEDEEEVECEITSPEEAEEKIDDIEDAIDELEDFVKSLIGDEDEDEEEKENDKEEDEEEPVLAESCKSKGKYKGKCKAKKVNEEDYSETVTCAWCGEEFDKSDCQHEVNLGWLCDTCIRALESRGEELEFDDGCLDEMCMQKLPDPKDVNTGEVTQELKKGEWYRIDGYPLSLQFVNTNKKYNIFRKADGTKVSVTKEVKANKVNESKINEKEDKVYELENRKNGATIWSHAKNMPGYKWTGKQSVNNADWCAKGDVPTNGTPMKNEEFVDGMSNIVTDVKDLDMPDALADTVDTKEDGTLYKISDLVKEIAELKNNFAQEIQSIKDDIKTALQDIKQDIKDDVKDIQSNVTSKLDNTDARIADLTTETEEDIEAEAEAEVAAEEGGTEAPAEDTDTNAETETEAPAEDTETEETPSAKEEALKRDFVRKMAKGNLLFEQIKDTIKESKLEGKKISITTILLEMCNKYGTNIRNQSIKESVETFCEYTDLKKYIIDEDTEKAMLKDLSLGDAKKYMRTGLTTVWEDARKQQNNENLEDAKKAIDKLKTQGEAGKGKVDTAIEITTNNDADREAAIDYAIDTMDDMDESETYELHRKLLNTKNNAAIGLVANFNQAGGIGLDGYRNTPRR